MSLLMSDVIHPALTFVTILSSSSMEGVRCIALLILPYCLIIELMSQ
jgi:hypothetical protein